MDQLESELVNTFGAAYIGAMIALALYGITTLQTYLYYIYYPKDKWGLKLIVAVIWVNETLHISFVSRFMYIYLIKNYGNPSSLTEGHWTLYLSVLCNVIIVTLMQSFFATRIYSFGKKKWLVGFITFFVVAHFAFGIEFVVNLFRINVFANFVQIKFSTALPFAIAAVVPDVLISGSLCYFLGSNKQLITGIRRTEILINTLMTYAINRALLTSTAAIVTLILYVVLPDSFSWLAVDFCVGKLYANTLLATLNARKSLRGKGLERSLEAASSPSHRGAVLSVLFHAPAQVQNSAVRGGSTNATSHSNSEFSNQSSFAETRSIRETNEAKAQDLNDEIFTCH